MAKRQILHSLRDRRENISCDSSNNPPSQKTNGPSLKYWLQYKEEKIHFSYDIIIPPRPPVARFVFILILLPSTCIWGKRTPKPQTFENAATNSDTCGRTLLGRTVTGIFSKQWDELSQRYIVVIAN